MSRRSQPSLPDTDEGHAQRLRRANDRAVSVLGASLASRAEMVSIGTQFTLHVDKRDRSVSSISYPTIDREQLAYLAILARPFTLQKEDIAFGKVARSLRRFAMTEAQRVMTDQLDPLRVHSSRPRMYMFAARQSDGQELISGGTNDAEVADRVLYSQIAHADDASDLLDQIDTDTQMWALASMVGDLVALIAHQQWITSVVRPDICPEISSWAGTPRTIFERLGINVEEIQP